MTQLVDLAPSTWSGDVIAAGYVYGAYGDLAASFGVGGAEGDNAYRFSTQPTDPVTALSRFHFRDYSSSAGRLLLVADDEPNFDMWTFTDRSFFYEDSDPNQAYDPNDPNNRRDTLVFSPNYVTVSATDALGYRTVVLDLSTLNNSPVNARLEFGLANGDNGTLSYVAVDDITLGCPDGYCCGPTGLPVPKPDDDPCKLYECDPNGPVWIETGTTNECCTGCFTGPTQPYGVLFMVDNSGSTSQVDLDNSIAAIIQLLDEWEAAYNQYPGSVILPREGGSAPNIAFPFSSRSVLASN